MSDRFNRQVNVYRLIADKSLYGSVWLDYPCYVGILTQAQFLRVVEKETGE
jgi:hypothetical protein